MKTVIAGCRDFNDYEMAKQFISELPFKITEVVSGGATGADALGERFAKENGIPIRLFPADWKTHKKAAGPIRNRLMAQYADQVVVFWDHKSRGTKNMIEEATKQSLNVWIKGIGSTALVQQ